MKKLIVVILIVFNVVVVYSKDKDIEIEKKVNILLEKMTLEEKIGQMNQYSNSWDLTGPKPDDERNEGRYEDIEKGLVGSMLNVNYVDNIRAAQDLALRSRLKIPLMFAVDVIHGYKTSFPIPIAMSASWDMEAIEQAERVAATEAAAAGINWTFNPVVDISRDPRWGRVMEFGCEDPYLGAQIGMAKVRGYQGKDLSDINTIAACVKHFAAYGAPNAGREYNAVDISPVELYNIYMPPYKACVDAGAVTFMNAFNTLNGVPATGNQFLVNDILRGKWGWNGVIVSDWQSISELQQHGVAGDLKRTAEIAVNGNTDIDMEGLAYLRHLKELVDEGKVKEEQIDTIVKRILTLKYKLGLFNDPYKYLDNERQDKVLFSEKNRKAALEAAKKTMVLLKNENNLLPLSKSVSSIALIGPLVKDKAVMLGNWTCQAESESAVSVFEGIEKLVSESTDLIYAEGCTLVSSFWNRYDDINDAEENKAGFQAAVDSAKKADVIIAVVGESAMMAGEASSRQDIGLPGVQKELLMELKKTGKPLVVVLMNGRPLAIPWVADNADAILEAWQAGHGGGDAIAATLFGNANPGGKLPMTFPRTVGQIPIYYNQLNTGRPKTREFVFLSQYIDGPNEPLYPFGFGLSYSTFQYSDLTIDKQEITRDEDITITVTIKNTSDIDGTEVVQLYIRDLVSTIARPVKELKAFENVYIKAGRTKRVKFKLNRDDLLYFDNEYKALLEPGEFEIMIGGNSRDVMGKKFYLK